MAALLVLAPAVDAMACQDEFSAPAVADQPVTSVDSVTDADHQKAGSCCPSCVQGQCQHPAVDIPVEPIVQAPLAALREAHARADGPAPPSEMIFGLKRPPRG